MAHVVARCTVNRDRAERIEGHCGAEPSTNHSIAPLGTGSVAVVCDVDVKTTGDAPSTATQTRYVLMPATPDHANVIGEVSVAPLDGDCNVIVPAGHVAVADTVTVTSRRTGSPADGGEGYASSVYVVVLTGATSMLPLDGTLPTPRMDTNDENVVDQLKVERCPAAIEGGVAVKN